MYGINGVSFLVLNYRSILTWKLMMKLLCLNQLVGFCEKFGIRVVLGLYN